MRTNAKNKVIKCKWQSLNWGRQESAPILLNGGYIYDKTVVEMCRNESNQDSCTDFGGRNSCWVCCDSCDDTECKLVIFDHSPCMVSNRICGRSYFNVDKSCRTSRVRKQIRGKHLIKYSFKYLQSNG